MPTSKRRYSVSFPDSLLASIEKEAEHYHMPISQMVLYLCVKGLDMKKEVPVFYSNKVADAPKRAVNER